MTENDFEREYYEGRETVHNLAPEVDVCPACGQTGQQTPNKVSRYFCNNRLCDVEVFRE